MFRAVLCSSSGGQIVCIQDMVSSLSVSGRGGRTVHRLRENVTVLYMFRAVLCSSSRGQIVYIQHMVSSLSMSGRGGRTVHRLREKVFSQPV